MLSGSIRLSVLLLLFFASGVAALVYEVLWLKELGRLFGVTAHATAATLAVFFLGLSAGTLVIGKASAGWRNPLRVYAFLELGIAATALLYFFLFDAYGLVLRTAHESVGYQPALWLLIRFVLAMGILFPPAFFMGGTLPVMAQFLVRRREELGRGASLLYAINTIGAATGALLAGFYMPRWFGFRGSYAVAIAINLAIAVFTFLWSRNGNRFFDADTQVDQTAEKPSQPIALPRQLWLVAGASGFLTLALEVLWTRMFAQVLQNSVYTFAVVLTVFLAALATGSALARRLCNTNKPTGVMITLLAVSGVVVAFTPDIFVGVNGGLASISPALGWNRYILSVFGHAFLVLGIPTLLIGSVFPSLMKLAERHSYATGPTIGRLASVNTLAAIAGSLAAGFAILPALGLWTSIRIVGAAYLLIAIYLVPRSLPRGRSLRGGLAVGALLLGTILPQRELAQAWVDPGQNEELVAVDEGVHGTVAVVRRGDDLRMKVNNSYLLGTSASTPNSRLMSHLPLALHPEPRRVFYLGMGTGITAGGALDFPVEHVLICELNSDVIRASRRHFEPYLNGLFSDQRVRVLPEDGRNYLSATRDKFDLIIADIFLTYRAGVGSLYTREHFETVRARLEPEGMFVQWLTLFDLSEQEFGIIARTMTEVFADVTLWRRGFSPRYPVFALVARNEASPLDLNRLQSGLDGLVEAGKLSDRTWLVNIPLAAYAGNMQKARDRFAELPISTDDRTPLEYTAPVTERNSKGSRTTEVLAWAPLVDYCFEILRSSPPEIDPYLADVAPWRRQQVIAGVNYAGYETHRRLGQSERAGGFLRAYERALAAGPDETDD